MIDHRDESGIQCLDHPLSVVDVPRRPLTNATSTIWKAVRRDIRSLDAAMPTNFQRHCPSKRDLMFHHRSSAQRINTPGNIRWSSLMNAPSIEHSNPNVEDTGFVHLKSDSSVDNHQEWGSKSIRMLRMISVQRIDLHEYVWSSEWIDGEHRRPIESSPIDRSDWLLWLFGREMSPGRESSLVSPTATHEWKSRRLNFDVLEDLRGDRPDPRESDRYECRDDNTIVLRCCLSVVSFASLLDHLRLIDWFLLSFSFVSNETLVDYSRVVRRPHRVHCRWSIVWSEPTRVRISPSVRHAKSRWTVESFHRTSSNRIHRRQKSSSDDLRNQRTWSIEHSMGDLPET